MTARELPRWLRLLAGVSLALVALPLLGLLVRVPWAELPALLADGDAQQALWLSLRTCVASTLLAVVAGTPLAIVLARAEGAWAHAARTLSALPMVLPPVVAGLALLVTFGRRGLVGSGLSLLGIEIAFSTVAVVMAQAFVAMPYYVVAVEAALRGFDAGYERVAASLGAGPSRTLWRVTLPLLAPALLSGTAMAMARALGEFGATLTFAGSLAGTTRTLTLELYLRRETDPGVALALAVVLIGLAVVLLAATTWLGRLLGGRRG